MICPPITIVYGILSQVDTSFHLGLSPPWCWLLFGLLCCLLEYFAHQHLSHAYRFIALMMGCSAIALAIILWRSASRLGIVWHIFMQEEGTLNLQVLYWIGLSFTAVAWVRPMFHRPKRSVMSQATEAETLTAIKPGKIGRVIYEGASWQASSENYHQVILPHQKVYVLRRDGNLLYVLPEDFFQA
jgi:membrane protein implicated in regulation of membrane protease activity